MTMVEFCEMRDKQSQQRRGRADGAVRSVADRSAVGENRALAPQTTQAPQGWPSVDREPSGVGRDSVDSPQRRSLAGPAGTISTSFHVLATTAGLGRAGRLAGDLAHAAARGETETAIEAGEGDEVEGGGRRRGCSSGRPPLFCIPGGSPARGDDAGGDPRKPAPSCGEATAEAGARDRRQSLRQRSAAKAVAAARHRTDLPAQEESRSSGDTGWSRVTAVSTPLDRRTNHRLVGELPTPGGAL